VEGLELSRRAASLDPEGYLKRMTAVDALLGLGRYGEAEGLARKALIQHPEIIGLRIRLAVALLAQGRPEDGAPLIQRATEESQGNPEFFNTVAMVLLLLPQPSPAARQEALAMAKMACQATAGTKPWHLLTLGKALQADGRKEAAEQAFKDCLAKAQARHMDGLIRLAGEELEGLQGEKSSVQKEVPLLDP
jgi:tetratricopeptide (TPR) repeat protein